MALVFGDVTVFFGCECFYVDSLEEVNTQAVYPPMRLIIL